jgi:hypothetical protein
VRNDSLGPIEERVAVVAHEDVTVVDLVVLQRARDAQRRERPTRLGESRGERAEPRALGALKVRDFVDESFVLGRQRVEPLVRNAEPEHVIRASGKRALQLHVRPDRGFEVPQRLRRRSEVPDPRPAASGQRPVALEVDGEDRHGEARRPACESLCQRRFEEVGARLEVHVAGS